MGVVLALLLGGVGVLAVMFFVVAPHLGNSHGETSCPRTGTQHTAVVKDGKVTPAHTDAKRCDTLTITNEDARARLMAFGMHDKHVAYDGVSQQRLEQGQRFTVTLNKTGDYLFHDHYDEDAKGTFSVTD